MVYDYYSFIEFAVVNSCKLHVNVIMKHYFTAYSLLDQLIAYIKEKHYSLFKTVFYSLLRYSSEKSVYLREGFCIA